MGQNDYEKKEYEDLLSWDPRPKKFRQTTVQEWNAFVLSIQKFEENGDPMPLYAHSVKLIDEDNEHKVVKNKDWKTSQF